MIDPKPKGRIIEDQLGWEQLRRLKLQGKRCRCCPEPARSLHHLIPRSQGGDDVPDNLVGLSGDGTRGCHGLVEAWDIATRARLRESLTEAEVFYVAAKKSRDYLEHAYPSTVTYCAVRGRVARVVVGFCEGCGEPAHARSFAAALEQSSGWACAFDDVDESGGLA